VAATAQQQLCGCGRLQTCKSPARLFADLDERLDVLLWLVDRVEVPGLRPSQDVAQQLPAAAHGSFLALIFIFLTGCTQCADRVHQLLGCCCFVQLLDSSNIGLLLGSELGAAGEDD
jgi:hypothetical protein